MLFENHYCNNFNDLTLRYSRRALDRYDVPVSSIWIQWWNTFIPELREQYQAPIESSDHYQRCVVQPPARPFFTVRKDPIFYHKSNMFSATLALQLEVKVWTSRWYGTMRASYNCWYILCALYTCLPWSLIFPALLVIHFTCYVAK